MFNLKISQRRQTSNYIRCQQTGIALLTLHSSLQCDVLNSLLKNICHCHMNIVVKNILRAITAKKNCDYQF